MMGDAGEGVADGTTIVVQQANIDALLTGNGPYTPPSMPGDGAVPLPCRLCKRKKKCRAGHRCANFDSCRRVLEHGHIYGGDGTAGSGGLCSTSECKGLAGVPINGAIAKRRLGWPVATTWKAAQPQQPAQQPDAPVPQPAVPPPPSAEQDRSEAQAGLLDDAIEIVVKKVVASRMCKDAAGLACSDLKDLGPSCPAYQPAFLVLADILYGSGKPNALSVLKWIPKDVLCGALDPENGPNQALVSMFRV
jgi:hypothetical protein